MTTIAYKDGWMAADSKCTDGWTGAFLTKTHKIWRCKKNGALVGQCGDADCRDILPLLEGATPKRMPTREQLANTKCSGSWIVAFPRGAVFIVDVETRNMGDGAEWSGSVVEIEERWCAVGSGQQFALGAMAAGKSAADAVHIACRYDSYSQAPVRSVPVNESDGRKVAK